MSVCVVIPTWNMADTVGLALYSACSQKPSSVIVLDDASEDKTCDIVSAYAKHFPFVRFIKRLKKSSCHVSASREIYESIQEDHVISLAADDVLMPGIVDWVEENIASPVVFSHYACDDGKRQWIVCHPFAETTHLSPEEMSKRIISSPPVETGIGSSVRRDVMRWLFKNGFHKLGPHSDSIGYATAGAIFGCTYIPIVGAAIRYNVNGYGVKNATERKEELAQESLTFMLSVGLDLAVATSLITKRCYGLQE